MLVNLYIITNDINNKVYIGQTTRSIESRWRKHIEDAIRRDGGYNKFHKAIIELGYEHFSIRLIDKFDASIIDKKEIEYIKKYDSYNNGYNSTLGGGTGLRINQEDRDRIRDLYISGESRANIARYMECNVDTVKCILIEYGISPDYKRNEPIEIVMYDENFNVQYIFDSKNEAYEYIKENENNRCDKQAFYGHLKQAITLGKIRYKHRWQLMSDLVHENKIFRTRFDKEAYLEGNRCRLDSKGYYITDNAIDFINYRKSRADNNRNNSSQNIKEDEIERCTVCGKLLRGRSYTGMCNSCSNVAAKGKTPKPSKEQLMNDMLNLNGKQIAEKYGRNPSTISTWIKSYNLR